MKQCLFVLLSVALLFAGNAMAQDLTGVPATVDYDTRVMNGCYTKTYTIENTSATDTHTVLAVTNTLAAFDAWVADTVLDPGETTTLTVRFEPPVDLPGPNVYLDVLELATDEPATYFAGMGGQGSTVIKSWDVTYGTSMISLPYKPVDSGFQALFGDDLVNAASWTVAGFDWPPSGWFWAHDGGDYADGMGYFLAVSDPDTVYTLSYEGYHYGCDNWEFDLDLDWNLIGVPDTLGYDLTACVYTHNGTDYSYADAISNGIIFPDSYFIAASLGGYVGYGGYVVGTNQAPLNGYWFRTAVEGVTMTVPSAFAGTPPLPPAPTVDETGDGWMARMLVTDGYGFYSAPQFGVADGASEGYDFAHDAPRGPESPVGGLPVQGYFQHADWETPYGDTQFMRDVQQPLEIGQSRSWTLTVSSDAEHELVLAWPEVELPDGVQVIVENASNGDLFDLADLEEYAFTAGPGETDFVITAEGIETSVADGTSTELPETFAIDRTYPNPFNPSTTVRFAVPRTADVTVGVYDINGRMVAKLADGTFAAGTHSVTWEARDHASGVYFVRMNGNGITDVAKIVLMK